jgi:hypothetical protein
MLKNSEDFETWGEIFIDFQYITSFYNVFPDRNRMIPGKGTRRCP